MPTQLTEHANLETERVKLLAEMEAAISPALRQQFALLRQIEQGQEPVVQLMMVSTGACVAHTP